MSLSGPRRDPADGRPPRALIVFVHGYGADGNDLIGLAEPLAGLLPHAAFASPDAPGRMPMGGRQWFPLTMRDDSERLRGVHEAAPALDGFLDDELARTGLTEAELALVGFSQGTMMSLHVAYRRPRAVAAVVGFSGLLADPSTDGLTPAPTLLVHGTADEVLPAGHTLQAAQTLGAAGIPVAFHMVEGLGHGIDPTGLRWAADHLRRYLPQE